VCVASAWVKGPRGIDVRVRLREYRGDDRIGYNSAGMVLPDTSWHRITVTLPVAGHGSSMDLNVYGKGFPPGQELLVDEISEVCR
jgi:hypothetical protein